MKTIHIAFAYAVLFSSSSLAQNPLFSSSSPIYWVYNSPTEATWLKLENQFNPLCLMTSSFGFTQPDNSAQQRTDLALITSNNVISGNFSIEGVQTSYSLVRGQGQIEMAITTREHLLITVYLFDMDGQEKAQTATLINNRTKNLILLLDNIVAGNYRLVIKALATDHQTAIKTFHITLADIVPLIR
ncbi:hypothetical protein [Yersinia similis]|uniref:N-acetylglucosamine-binding protein A n=1 Tax=Yersinia similis TaxID=367190 RepID=A0A0T9RHG1_9GAMM|nr:hypothetical protein [Yersinia similis]CNF16747.1 N-acetylglucosamine-binding protein A [Yersinia similis]CNI62939.1 N-acetylglucosamine-binding protein A [Yersinia similis]